MSSFTSTTHCGNYSRIFYNSIFINLTASTLLDFKNFNPLVAIYANILHSTQKFHHYCIHHHHICQEIIIPHTRHYKHINENVLKNSSSKASAIFSLCRKSQHRVVLGNMHCKAQICHNWSKITNGQSLVQNRPLRNLQQMLNITIDTKI